MKIFEFCLFVSVCSVGWVVDFLKVVRFTRLVGKSSRVGKELIAKCDMYYKVR